MNQNRKAALAEHKQCPTIPLCLQRNGSHASVWNINLSLPYTL